MNQRFNSPTKFDYPSIYIFVICILCVLSIIAYGTYRCKTPDFQDPLTGSFFEGEAKNFMDGWGMIHFVFYGVLAYLFPRKLPLIFLFGVAWEVIESIFHDHPFYISKCNYNLSTDQQAGWWYGRWQDIVMNSCGMALGYLIRMNQ